MESPGLQPDTPLTDEDEPIPCKGCNKVLEEGKAFELAGNRWHIDCFRCHTCRTLLDSDANLLLLGDGSLICNSCTYSCSACNNKIEDLAILTGDQAFCAGCFRCKNCKRKIENLKYARTSQGIFCMNCHETLMARRKKKTKPPLQKTPTIGSNSASPMLLDKSLPSLPVEEDDVASLAHSTTPTDASPRLRPATHRTNSSKSNHNPTPDQLSPMGFSGSDSRHRAPKLYKRHSQTSQLSDVSFDNQQNGSSHDPYSSFIPLVLDDSPGPSPAPLPNTAYRPSRERERQSSQDALQHYYERPGREQEGSRPSYERTVSETSSSYYDAERDRRPHIASQDKTYQPHSGSDIPRKSHDSDRDRREKLARNTDAKDSAASQQIEFGISQSKIAADSDTVSSSSRSEKPTDFKLGEVPRERKRSYGSLKALDTDDVRPHSPSADTSPVTSTHYVPPRSDSFKTSHVASSKVPNDSPNNSTSSSNHSHATSKSSDITADSPDILVPGERVEKPQGLQLSTRTTVTNISHQESPSFSHQNSGNSVPRSSPRRPTTANDSSFSPHSDTNSQASPVLPPFHSPIGNLGFDEELRKVFGGESILRRVSNSVGKHGRSYSDMAGRNAQSPKWPRSPSSGNAGYIGAFSPEIGSPTTAADAHGENVVLKQELRRSTQKIAELEARLQNTASAKALEINIQEKRNTVALLETEREAFLRELMLIKERLDGAKDGKSIDFEELKTDLIRNLTQELEALKETLKADIQALVVQRDQLLDDVENCGRLREQAIQETEQLNLKNSQLADLNNELTRKIQGQFKANKNQVGGLGIYDGNNTDLLDIKEHSERRPTTSASATPTAVSIGSLGVPIQEIPTEGTEVFVAKVSTLKNGPQPKKFFWKKPGASLMKGAGKGFNKLLASENPKDGYSEMQIGVDSLYLPRSGSASEVPGTKLFGGTYKKSKKVGQNGTISATSNVAIFGGDLEMRAEFEGNRIPNVVQKCIQEVEMRGMDFEGIYRKSGGATQMRQIQDQFERGEDVQFDPQLDICSVTSVLKQYFRNLPNPLITYESYDRFVDTTTVFEEEKRLKLVKEIMDDLPPTHRDVLQFVIFHLARVASRKEENLMNTRNLAVVFAPTLLRHTSDEREMTDMHAKNNAIQFLIDYNEKIF